MKKGDTLLHRMCRNGNDDSIDLVERVCETVPEHINAKDKPGSTPLHRWSHKCQSIGIAGCLLKKGAHVNAKNNDGLTPIMYCAEEAKDEEAIEFFLEHGAETHHKDKDGKDLLELCKENGLKNIEALLLSLKK